MFETKVGDEVGYARYGSSWGTLLHHGFGRVAKINHHGHIYLEDGLVFDRHGDQRQVKHGGLRLRPAENLRHELKLREEHRARNRAAQELCRLVDAQRNGHGNICPVSDETRASMIELVNQL
jgi:hypothetical protein